MKRLIIFLVLIYSMINLTNVNAQINKLKLFRSGEKYGYIDSISKKVIITAKYKDASDFNSGLASVRLDSLYGCIDQNDHTVVPYRYDFIFPFQDGLAWVKIGKKYGFIDNTGKEVIPIIYDKVYGFNDGIACVKLNYKWGYVDKSGNVIIPIKYDRIESSFHEGLAAFNIGGKEAEFSKFVGGKWGYIDKNGNEIIPPKYDKWTSFRNDSAFVIIDNEKFWINKKGERIKQ